MSGYLRNIQSLRGIAALLILLLHLIKFGNAKYGLGMPELKPVADLSAIGVDTFFVISGFIMIYTTKRDGGLRDALRFAGKRVFRIYPTWWFLSLLLLPIFLMKPEWINSGSAVATSLWHSFLLVPHEGAPLIMVGWTLEYELFFYLIFAIGIAAIPRRFMIAYLTLWGVASVTAGEFITEKNAIIDLITNRFLLEFLAGCWAAEFIGRDIRLSRITLSMIGAVGAAWLIYGYGEGWSRVILFIVPSTALVTLLLLLERDYQIVFARLWQYMGDISYPLYLIHVPAISAVGKVWFYFDLNNALPISLMITAMTVVSLVSAAMIHHLVEMPSNSILRRYFGLSAFK